MSESYGILHQGGHNWVSQYIWQAVEMLFGTVILTWLSCNPNHQIGEVFFWRQQDPLEFQVFSRFGAHAQLEQSDI